MAAPMKVGLIGTGGISNRHMIPYLERPDRVQLTAVCDIVESLAQDYAKRAGVDEIYLDFEEMLQKADIDAVDICTGHSSHAPLAIAAANAGKHVIVEKAMAHTLQGCKDMIEAADKAGVTLMVAQHLRYSPESRAVKRFIDEGNLGEIRAVRTHSIGGGGGDRRPDDWMKDGKAGGGVMLVQSVHHLDLLRFYVGNVKRVMGISRSLQENFLNDADDLVAATLEFENGAVGDLMASWSTPVSPEGMSYMILGSEGAVHSTPPTLDQSLEAPVRQFGTIMYGVRDRAREEEQTRAMRSGPLRRPMTRERLALMMRRPSFQPLPTGDNDLPSDDYFINEVLHWEECCRTGEEPISSGHDNLETMKIVFGIFESSRTGKVIDLADL
ncbi:MAG: Gfo/Idh/MocA family oxidoreductase [Gammaproteobacteria bacterium]|nr:Gfo/Idh/MocA family oxidoreductase [Gammaproteobacteria bacterium]MDE0451410.1 Gfo/Idh/MocA family oxidoreductase [Gammaproteobacteria bacterium]